MTFQFDRKTISAVDPVRGITVVQSTKFYDINDRYFFIYRDATLEFEFSAMQREEKRIVMIKSALEEKALAVQSLILEPSLKKGFTKALKGQPLNSQAYTTLKNDVVEAMFALATWGGDLLSFVPDYEVVFIQDLADLK
ncbi:hypothetical protein D0B32_08150 [Paraburkholderia sp. DHOC27]|nr:hypothetical protein D0B32_08150 [Paraburkholderia sp. DHOC27]